MAHTQKLLSRQIRGNLLATFVGFTARSGVFALPRPRCEGSKGQEVKDPTEVGCYLLGIAQQGGRRPCGYY